MEIRGYQPRKPEPEPELKPGNKVIDDAIARWLLEEDYFAEIYGDFRGNEELRDVAPLQAKRDLDPSDNIFATIAQRLGPENANQFVIEMCKRGHGRSLLDGLRNLVVLDTSAAQAMIDANLLREVESSISAFSGLSQAIAEQIANDFTWGRNRDIRDKGLKPIDATARWLETGEKRFSHFRGLTDELFQATTRRNQYLQASNNLASFSNLSLKSAIALAEKGYVDKILKNQASFAELTRDIEFIYRLSHRSKVEDFNFDKVRENEGSPWARELAKIFDSGKFSKQYLASQEFCHAMDGLRTHPDGARLVPLAANARMTHGLSPLEFVNIADGDPAFLTTAPSFEGAGKALIRSLRDKWKYDLGKKEPDPTGWGAINEGVVSSQADIDLNVARQLEDLASVIGWDSAMRYANKVDVPRHDAYGAVEATRRFLKVNHMEMPAAHEFEGFSDADYYGSRPVASREKIRQLFEQVSMDDSKYADGRTSQQEFAEVARKLGFRHTVEDILKTAETLGVEPLTARVRNLRDNPRFDPLYSWKGIKELAAIADLIARRDVLDALRGKGVSEATRKFAYGLLEHPNVPAGKILEFLRDPEKFLSSSAEHVPEERQDQMSPSNMMTVDRLGLSAAEIRDALADGTMDKLQILPEFERRFEIGENGEDMLSTEYLQPFLLKALGRRDRNEAGVARDVKKLFATVQSIFEKHGVTQENRRPWLLGESWMVPAYRTEALARDLREAVFDKDVGIDRPTIVDVRVRLGRKSDPSLIVAGNDTASCMPFGDGKTNVYAWSPACAQMVVERRLADGTWRTMAQSVVMPTLPGDTLAPARFGELLGGKSAHQVFAPGEFSRVPVILCDNAEPSPNDIAEGRRPVIEAAYRRFFKDYLSKNAAMIGMDPTRVIIGKENYLGDARRWTYERTPNVFVPMAPISYSDNNEEESYVIELEGGDEGETASRPPLTPPPYEEGERGVVGIRDVTGRDILEMAYLEGKGFADNESIMFGLYDRQHRIVGSMISREQHGDPGLMFAARDDKGEPIGYMLAYVGHEFDVPEIYIDDFAVDRAKGLLAPRYAIRLLETFLDRLIETYGASGGAFPSVFAQMRESTSYQLIANQLPKLAAKRGLIAEMVEEGLRSVGGEPARLVRIYFGRTDRAVVEAKGAWEDRREREGRGNDEAEDDE